MTVKYTADVFCDACGNWIPGATSDEVNGLATEAVRKAKEAGWSRWTRSAYLDVCPECLKKEQRGELPQRTTGSETT